MPTERPRALAVQHVAVEPPNLIAAALQAEGIGLDVVRSDRGEPVPMDVERFSAVIVMGGPMSVADAGRLVHLRHEMRLVESALEREIPVLGVCLGSQILAHVLGSRVAPARFLELGWLPVSLTPDAARDPLLGACPPRFTALHWHGDARPGATVRPGRRPPGASREEELGPTPVRIRTYRSHRKRRRFLPEARFPEPGDVRLGLEVRCALVWCRSGRERRYSVVLPSKCSSEAAAAAFVTCTVRST